ncbi:MAG: futalosine hydrolase [Deltaproteobacteria bacterium]|nr:futalosine hydrolase [Deltaproteobacteria bacterium]MBW2048590.1 futalosine hydrolase [Deltaproteobacteria bacterium]MBW2111872.1 futalosine hydrolase [Deltaproteobacteria bacterium]
MGFLIVAAVKKELDLLLSEFRARPEGRTGGCTSYVGKAGDYSLRFGVTGVGLASACLALGGLLSLEIPEAIIIVGSAGALPGSGLEAGDVVVSRLEILAEAGVVVGPGMGDTELLGLSGLEQEIALDQGLGADLHAAAGRVGPVVHGRVLTVVGVSANQDQARARARRFRAVAENMEGYAVALAGRDLGIRTAEVRSISNRAGDRDKNRWDLGTANHRSQSVVLEYLRGCL